MYQYMVWNKKLEREKKKLVFFPFCSFHNIHIIYLLRPSTIMIHLALRPAHSDSKWLKLAGNKLNQSDFTSFDKNISANLHYFRYRSLPGLHIHIRQIVAVAIMIRQFHEFFDSSIWQVFWQLAQLCGEEERCWQYEWRGRKIVKAGWLDAGGCTGHGST